MGESEGAVSAEDASPPNDTSCTALSEDELYWRHVVVTLRPLAEDCSAASPIQIIRLRKRRSEGDTSGSGNAVSDMAPFKFMCVQHKYDTEIRSSFGENVPTGSEYDIEMGEEIYIEVPNGRDMNLDLASKVACYLKECGTSLNNQDPNQHVFIRSRIVLTLEVKKLILHPIKDLAEEWRNTIFFGMWPNLPDSSV